MTDQALGDPGVGEQLLQVEGLGVTARHKSSDRVVVRSMSLSISSGESLGLVGESGSGKSMTARAIMRLLPPSFAVTGEVTFDGRAVYGMTKAEVRAFHVNDVAMIFQDPRAHTNPVRTIGDFMTEGMRLQKGTSRSAADKAAERLLADVGIPQPARRLRQYPHEMSGGMLQRVMIASAFASNPRLLVADEPTTALDATTQSDIMAMLGEMRRERSLALLFITHDLELASATCDRIAVMYAGSLAETGPASILESEPSHPYTLGLLRSRPPIERRLDRLQAIPGRPISAHEITDGCPFSSRCWLAVEQCRDEVPALRPYGGSTVACHRAEELSAMAAAGPGGSS